MSILDGYVRDQLNEALTAACIASDAVLTVQTVSGPSYDPTIVDVPHACSGWRDTFSAAERLDSSVLVTDVKVYLLASSLDVVPQAANTVTIDGAEYSIISVQLDPASVAYVCQCRI